jgi:hypothetical protein
MTVWVHTSHYKGGELHTYDFVYIEDELGGACRTNGGDESAYRVLIGKPKHKTEITRKTKP